MTAWRNFEAFLGGFALWIVSLAVFTQVDGVGYWCITMGISWLGAALMLYGCRPRTPEELDRLLRGG